MMLTVPSLMCAIGVAVRADQLALLDFFLKKEPRSTVNQGRDVPLLLAAHMVKLHLPRLPSPLAVRAWCTRLDFVDLGFDLALASVVLVNVPLSDRSVRTTSFARCLGYAIATP